MGIVPVCPVDPVEKTADFHTLLFYHIGPQNSTFLFGFSQTLSFRFEPIQNCLK
jgi:hypothetical protein